MQNMRQKRFEAEHSQKNEFVKRQQAELARHAGRAPKMNPDMMDFCSYMSNNGMHAQELARDATRGIDNVAFPVKPGGRDDS